MASLYHALNWPMDHRERCKTMFNKETLSDVKFVVQASQNGKQDTKRGTMEVPAHKFLFSICSPVFFAMFCGEMAETEVRIDLPDCEYEGMLELLRYIYMEEVCLNRNNVMQVLYLAEKYMIAGLATECIKYLERNLDVSNVLCVFKHAERYGKEELLCHCWEMIDKDTKEALKSNDLLSMDRSFLNQLVERDSLNIREVELFKALNCWAKEECKRQQLDANGPLMKRQVLGKEIIEKIRFPIMKEEEFDDVVTPSNILTTEETEKILKYFSSNLSKSSMIGFSNVYRVGSLLRCPSYKSFYPNANHIDKTEVTDWVIFQIDRPIMLHGVSILGSDGGEYTIDLTVYISYDDDSELFLTTKTGTYTSGKKSCNNGFYYGFDVIFDRPVVVEAMTDKTGCNWCNIDSSVFGPGRCLGNEEIYNIYDVEHSGVNFVFDYSEWIEDRIYGTLARNIFAEILFTVKE